MSSEVSPEIRAKEFELLELIEDAINLFFSQPENKGMKGNEQGQILVDLGANLLTNSIITFVEPESSQMEVMDNIFRVARDHIKLYNSTEVEKHELH